MTDFGPLSPSGKPNLVAEPAPRRGTVPGSGGFFAGPTMIAVAPPAIESDAEWRARDDEAKLALAPKADLARLATEQSKLTAARSAVTAAEAAEEQAKARIVDARVAGRDAQQEERAFDAAVNAASAARRNAGIQEDVVEALRSQLVHQVRKGLSGPARVRLEQAQHRYDTALAALAGAVPLVAALRAARAEEAVAAADLAAARGDVPGVGFSGQRAERVTGHAYRTIPEDVDRLSILVDQQTGEPLPFDDGAGLGRHLARRPFQQQTPSLKPIDQED